VDTNVEEPAFKFLMIKKGKPVKVSLLTKD
jgi:hypothetical protein